MPSFKQKPGRIDYGKLPPLVHKGGDRKKIIADLAEKWSKALPKPSVGVRPTGHVLDQVALIDENHDSDHPARRINLGEILENVANRINSNSKSQVHNPSTPAQYAVSLSGCRIDDWKASGSTVPFHLSIKSCKIDCEVSLRSVTWKRDLVVTKSAFCKPVDFTESQFEQAAIYTGTSFESECQFERADFVREAYFTGCTFRDEAIFKGGSFVHSAWFIAAQFKSKVSFDGGTFGSFASFQYAHFDDMAFFDNAVVKERLIFDKAIFADFVSFRFARLDDKVTFIGAHFGGSLRADPSFANVVLGSSILDQATFGRTPPKHGLACARFLLWEQGRQNRNWAKVRAFGEMAVLTRASMAALVTIPLLAGLWPAVRGSAAQFGHLAKSEEVLSPDMPWPLGALFFASLLVIAGRMFYQSRAAEFVQGRSKSKVRAEEMASFRAFRKPEGDRRLREAVGWLEMGADAVPHRRHRNLVSHHGQTVWIPSRIEDFKPPASDQTVEKAESLIGPYGQSMGQEEREDIAIQASSGAHYDYSARLGRRAAGWAMLCYLIASGLIALIVWQQSVVILHEMGLARFAWLVAWGLPALCFGGSLVAVFRVLWLAWFRWWWRRVCDLFSKRKNKHLRAAGIE